MLARLLALVLVEAVEDGTSGEEMLLLVAFSTDRGWRWIRLGVRTVERYLYVLRLKGVSMAVEQLQSDQCPLEAEVTNGMENA